MGKEKSRMTQSVKQREVGQWSTIMVSASNDSLLNLIVSRTSTTTAGLYRVFEYEVTPGVTGQIDSSVVTRMVAKLNNNFGGVGLKYAEYLGNNFAQIDAEVDLFLRQLNAEVDALKEERFWTSLVGSLLLGAKYANQLGLTQINEDALKVFLLETLQKMRGERNSQPVDMKIAMNVSNQFAQFLNAMRARHTIRTNRIHIARGRPAPNSIKVLGDASRLDGIYVHVGMEDKIMRVSSTALSEWCTDKDLSRHIFLQALENELGCKRVHGRIASGTEFAGATEYLLEFDLAGTALTNFIDEA
jgi:hypothetical protein